LTIKAAGDADLVFAADIDLDLLRDDRRLGRDRILLRCNYHRNQLRDCGVRWRTGVFSIALSPTENLVRVHVVLPGYD